MKNNIITTILVIVAVFGGMALNFQEFLMGHPATVKNLVVTIVYIAIWIIVLTIGIKAKKRGVIRFCSIFWTLMLFLSMLTVFVNTTDISAHWALPLVILLIGQWYGISFFIASFLTTSIIMTLISLVMLSATALSLKRRRFV